MGEEGVSKIATAFAISNRLSVYTSLFQFNDGSGTGTAPVKLPKSFLIAGGQMLSSFENNLTNHNVPNPVRASTPQSLVAFVEQIMYGVDRKGCLLGRCSQSTRLGRDDQNRSDATDF